MVQFKETCLVQSLTAAFPAEPGEVVCSLFQMKDVQPLSEEGAVGQTHAASMGKSSFTDFHLGTL